MGIFKYGFVTLNLLIIIILFQINEIFSNEDAKRLFDDLLSDYNSQIRPVEKTEDIIELRLGIKLSQIADIVNI
jgi:nicotinic acetylcholine receptor, invertebrate